MKNLFFGTIFSMMVVSVTAQEAGNIWVGGSLSGAYTNGTGNVDNKAFRIGPEFGYILSDKLGIGIDLNLGYARSTTSQEEISYNTDGYYYYLSQSKYTDKSIAVMPFVRYSFLKSNLGALFIDGGLYYSHSRNKSVSDFYSHFFSYFPDDFMPPSTHDQYINKTITNAYGVRFRPGVAINLSEKFSIIGKLGFAGYTHTRTEGRHSNSYSLSLDMKDISFGGIFTF